jgi:hypothetical protein
MLQRKVCVHGIDGTGMNGNCADVQCMYLGANIFSFRFVLALNHSHFRPSMTPPLRTNVMPPW